MYIYITKLVENINTLHYITFDLRNLVHDFFVVSVMWKFGEGCNSLGKALKAGHPYNKVTLGAKITQ